MDRLNLILAALILAVVVLPVLPLTHIAHAQEGKPVTQIVFAARTSMEGAIFEVARGDADIFIWSMGLQRYKNLDPTILASLKLYKSVTTYYDLALNPASNVIDPNAPGKVKLKDVEYPGKVIPGLVVWDADKDYGKNWVNITEIKDWKKVHFNPWGIQKMRLALQFLVDRDFIVKNILGGSANPALGAIRPSHPAYPRLKHIYEELGLTPTGDKEKAVRLFKSAVDELRPIYQKYGMDLYYKNGKLYFKKPDGTEEPVTINFVIRVEDERLDIGRLVSKWLEQYFGLTVNRIERERSVVTPVIYGKNLIDTSEALGGVVWSIYTEGWVTMGEDIDVWARYDVAFFYAPLRGYGPNHRITNWWYYYNETEYKWGVDLYYGSYTQENVNELWKEIEDMLRAGIRDSLRIFLTENIEFFPVNKNNVVSLVPGVASGLWTPWALRTLETKTGKATILEYSASGALFMSAWNTVLGFTDVYSETIGRLVRDFAFYSSPNTGIPLPIRVKGFEVIKKFERKDGKIIGEIPVSGYVYDPYKNKWVPANTSEKVPAKVILNFKFGKWHDGSPENMEDVLYWYAFYWEWSSDESTNTTKDPYYDPEIEEAMSYTMSLIKGLEVLNETAIAIYTDYLDVYDVLIASMVAIYPDMPWHVMAAAEKMITEKWPTPGGLPYGWTDREGVMSAINFIKPDHARDVKKALEQLEKENFVPPYISTYPGFEHVADVKERYDNSIKFIDERGHAFISNGPYYVESYVPETNRLVLKWFKDYVYPPGYWSKKLEVWTVDVTDAKIKPSIAFAGDEVTVTLHVKLYRVAPTTKEVEPTDATIVAGLYMINETTGKPQLVTSIPDKYIVVVSPGVYQIRLPSDFTSEYLATPGTYYIEVVVSHPKSGVAITESLLLTSLGSISPTLTTTTVVTTATVVTTVSPSPTPTPTPTGTVSTVTVTKTLEKTVTTTATTTATTTVAKTVTKPVTTTVTATNWATASAIGVVGLIIGIVIGWAIRRR
ncbi:MAG: peptide transporter [Pyrodictiaceae archaeon]